MCVYEVRQSSVPTSSGSSSPFLFGSAMLINNAGQTDVITHRHHYQNHNAINDWSVNTGINFTVQ